MQKPRFSSDVQSILDEMEALTGKATRASELAAWALLFRSPFRSYETKAKSWIGGVPCAPAGFPWPRDSQGQALHFLAQIDLSSLKAEPTSGACPPGLPRVGALLVFAGTEFAIRMLDRCQAELAAPLMPPDDLCDVRELGFFGSGKTFNAWAVDPVPYLSKDGEEDYCLKSPFQSPEYWITNWAIADLEASVVLYALQLEVKRGRSLIENRKKALSQGRSLTMPKTTEERLQHIEKTERAALELISFLESWRNIAKAEPPEAAVDRAGLQEVFAKRLNLQSLMKKNYGSKDLLLGDSNTVWTKILQDLPTLDGHPDFSNLPAAYRSFAEMKITGWRRHRLFGL